VHCPARDVRREFSRTLPVRAVDGRLATAMRQHAYTERERERERDTAGGEGWPHGCRDSQ